MSRVVAHVDLKKIARNLDIIARAAGFGSRRIAGAVPMVKSNAYGHGLVEVARAVERRPVTKALGVATIDEGAALREAGVRKPIWVFSGCAPWSEEIAQAARRYRLTPVIHTFEDLKKLLSGSSKRGRPRPSEYHLKFNTGMNRLGIAWEEAEDVRRLLARHRAAGAGPQGLCTHFALGESRSNALTRAQAERFRALVATFSTHDISYIHCSNSAASLTGAGEIAGEDASGEAGCLYYDNWVRARTVIRPGIGIYGYCDVACAGLKPALRLSARVLATRRLRPGARVGYGATYRVRRPCAQAVLAIGYGDGLFRALSNSRIRVGGREVEVVGRVSMDLTSIGMAARPGAWVTLLGEDAAQAPRMAASAGTIVYELLTAISQRVPRIYEGL